VQRVHSKCCLIKVVTPAAAAYDAPAGDMRRKHSERKQ
jgi:hypothetical protein